MSVLKQLGASLSRRKRCPQVGTLSTTLRAAMAASARLSVRLAAVALLLAASVAALLAAERLMGLFFGPVPRWPVTGLAFVLDEFAIRTSQIVARRFLPSAG